MSAPRPRRENKLTALFRPRSRPRPPHAPPDPQPYSDPPRSSVRPQNRPVSSTTTATHSTITPLPSDSLRYRLDAHRHPHPLHPQSADSRTSFGDLDQSSVPGAYDSDDQNVSRSETPSSVRRRPLLHSLFGISLTRKASPSVSTSHRSSPSRKASTSTSTSDRPKSRMRSFRLTSRPPTPKSVDDPSPKSPFFIPVPSSPLPLAASPRRRSFGLASSQRSTPKSSTSHLPLPLPQSPLSTRPHARRHSVGSERPPHDSAVALSEEFSHRTTHKPVHSLPDSASRIKGKERENHSTDAEQGLLSDAIDFPSQSTFTDPPPIPRNHVPSHSARHPTSHLLTIDSASSDENEQFSRRLPVIPQIIHTPATPQRAEGKFDATSPLGLASPVADPGRVEIARAKVVTIAQQERILVPDAHPHHPAPSKGRFTPRIFSGNDLPKNRDSSGQKSNRRPSVDGSVPKTSGSNVTGLVRNMTSHRSKLGSFDFERPVSALNRSTSTVDRQATRSDTSHSKTRLQSLERTISADSAQGGKSHPGLAETPVLSQTKPIHTGDTSAVSLSSVSVQTMPSAKGIGSNPSAEQSSSWGHLSGRHILRTSHGTLAFEHPSSVPNSPNPEKFSLPSGPNQPGLPQSQSAIPLHTIVDVRVEHSRGPSHTSSGHGGPTYLKSGEPRPKGKGRSLDLGLGLSWAPSRVREEALMPGLIFTREKAKREKNKANGSDVTKVFETILSEPRFQTFKQYVHRFDAHIIPLEGPSGLLASVEELLTESNLSERERNKLMSDFTMFVENHSG